MSKQKYFADKLFEYKANLKNTWQIFSTIIGRTNYRNSIADMFHVHNQIIKDPNVIADKLCE